MRMRDEDRFQEVIRELAEDHRVLKMGDYIQHGNTTTYEHVMSVAHTAYHLNHFLHLKADDHSLVKVAVLHDYYLYDWHTYGDKLHGYHHAQIAAENAARDFDLTEKEQNMIRSHMWPLNLFSVPASRGAWLLTIADKMVSTRETIMDRVRAIGEPA